tara:strand:- start:3985 stop:4587 length:603 start_codon:yes stop_codon:yes gene_type:complete
MALEFTFINIFKIISTLSPFLISFYFLISSILDQNIKGFIYLIGVIFATFLNIFFLKHFTTEELKKKEIQKDSIACGLLQFPSLPVLVEQTSVPCTNSLFHAFTLTYIVLSMFNNNIFNAILIVFLVMIYGIDTVVRFSKGCSNGLGIFMGSIVGVVFGIFWFALVWITGIKELLYYDELTSNNVKCVKTKQKFTCKPKK